MDKLIALFCFVISVCFVPCGVGHAQSGIALQAYHVLGQAYDSDGELIYTETLTYAPDEQGGRLHTYYENPDNEKLAFKEVLFANSLTAPGFSLTDLATKEREGVEWLPDGQAIRSYQGDSSATLAVPKGPKIFDAGFDHFIKLNWDALIKGETLKVNYLFARDNKFIKLRLKKSPPPKNHLIETVDDQAFFKISANNLLFRMLSSPLFVGYDLNSRSLRYYSGPSNLPMMKDEKQVLIVYQSQDRHLAQNFPVKDP